MQKYNIAVVGATGMVGSTFLKVLAEQNLPVNNYFLFASKKSAGKSLSIGEKSYIVEELTENCFDNKNIDIALFSAGGSISEKFAPIAAKHGIVVIDNSSFWRMDPLIPLVVPEVNPDAIAQYKNKNIIANPNCSTIQAVVALKPLRDNFGLKRIVYSTYQAVSGAGVAGHKDLQNGIEGKPHEKFQYQIFNNCIPQIDSFLDTGYTKEEQKMIDETQKIFNDYNVKITATTVRVPVFDSHSESINVEFKKPFNSIDEVKSVLAKGEGIVIQDDIANSIYPLALDAKDKDEVFVGRVRRDFSIDNGINLWVVADNIRKGAATNTVQIAKELIRQWNNGEIQK